MYPGMFNYRFAKYSVLLLLCLSSLSLDAQRKEITYKDNKLVLFVHPRDTNLVMDPLTGEEKHIITRKSDDVLSLNAERVHKIDDEQAVEMLRNAIEEKIMATVGKLGKATYNYYTETVVINKQGKVVYVRPGNIYPISVVDIDGKEKQPNIPDDVRTQLNEEVAQIIESTKVPPIEIDGEPANVAVHINGNFVVE